MVHAVSKRSMRIYSTPSSPSSTTHMQNIFKKFLILSIFLVYVTCHNTEDFTDIVGRRRTGSSIWGCENNRFSDAKTSCVSLVDGLRECKSSHTGRSCREKAYCKASDKFNEDLKSGVSSDYLDVGRYAGVQCSSYDRDLIVNKFLNWMEKFSGYKHRLSVWYQQGYW